MPIAHKYLPHYTYDDYVQWEGNWELVDGIPFAMSPSPTPLYQLINANLAFVFKSALKNMCEHCKVYIPIDWKIAEDTIVQPDLLIVCKEIGKKFLDFTPALVIEIISPSSAFNDRNIKRDLYLSQKVKYYIIVDPQFKKVEIYQFTEGNYTVVAISPATFTFDLDEGCTIAVNLLEIWD